MSVHRTDRRTNPYVARWRDSEGRNRSRSIPNRREAVAFDREMREATREQREGRSITTAVAHVEAEFADDPAGLRAAVRALRAFANVDRGAGAVADELDRRADARERS